MSQDLLSSILNIYFQIFKSNAHSLKFPLIVNSKTSPQYSSLRDHVSLHDLQIETADASIDCHKLIAFGSGYIKRLIETDGKALSIRTIDLKEYDAHTMNDIVTFLYDAKCSIVSVEHAIKLFNAANTLEIPALVHTCKTFLYNPKMILEYYHSTGCQLDEVKQYLEWLIKN